MRAVLRPLVAEDSAVQALQSSRQDPTPPGLGGEQRAGEVQAGRAGGILSTQSALAKTGRER